MIIYVSTHLLRQTRRNRKIISKKKKKKRRTGLKDLERESRRDEIKAIRIKLTLRNRSTWFSILKSFPLDRKKRLKLFNDSILLGIIRGNRAKIIWPIEFFIANCSRVASFKGWFASKPVDPSFTSRNCISHATLAASFLDDGSPIRLPLTDSS